VILPFLEKNHDICSGVKTWGQVYVLFLHANTKSKAEVWSPFEFY
jgi:hypothetical protein